MSRTSANSWESVKAEAMRRITERIWRPGELIPNEEDLASEFGCARATVNRAMQELAEAGLVERDPVADDEAGPVRDVQLRTVHLITVEQDRVARRQVERHRTMQALGVREVPVLEVELREGGARWLAALLLLKS